LTSQQNRLRDTEDVRHHVADSQEDGKRPIDNGRCVPGDSGAPTGSVMVRSKSISTIAAIRPRRDGIREQ
jgi:hypothetical protein